MRPWVEVCTPRGARRVSGGNRLLRPRPVAGGTRSSDHRHCLASALFRHRRLPPMAPDLSARRFCAAARHGSASAAAAAPGRGCKQHFYHVSFGMLVVLAVAPAGRHQRRRLRAGDLPSSRSRCSRSSPIRSSRARPGATTSARSRSSRRSTPEPRNLRPTVNSQCEKCTACKSSCPDINQENTYWKEVAAAGQTARATSPSPASCSRSTSTTSCRPAPGSTTSAAAGRIRIGLVRHAFLPGVDAYHGRACISCPAVPRAVAAAVDARRSARPSASPCSRRSSASSASWLIKTGRATDQAVGAPRDVHAGGVHARF